jgi:hypothetical protein
LKLRLDLLLLASEVAKYEWFDLSSLLFAVGYTVRPLRLPTAWKYYARDINIKAQQPRLSHLTALSCHFDDPREADPFVSLKHPTDSKMSMEQHVRYEYTGS